MLKIQEEQMQEYLDQIEQSTDKPDELRKIIRKEQRTWITIISDIMFIIVMMLAVFAMFNGAFQKTNITIDTQGIICQTDNPNKYPTGMQIQLPTKTQPNIPVLQPEQTNGGKKQNETTKKQ